MYSKWSTRRSNLPRRSESRPKQEQIVLKQIWTGLIVAAATLLTSSLPAQSAKPVTLDLAAGAAIPVGDFSDGFNTGFNGTAGLGLSSIGSPVGIRLEGMYNKFGGRD